MEEILSWIIDKITWIFSGIGVFILGLFINNRAKKKRVSQEIKNKSFGIQAGKNIRICLLYTSPSPRDRQKSRMPSSA